MGEYEEEEEEAVAHGTIVLQGGGEMSLSHSLEYPTFSPPLIMLILLFL